MGGGAYDAGLLYKINTDGSGYTALHQFNGTNGQYPTGQLTISGSTLYGVTSFGGTSSSGTIFKIDTDGSNYSILHSFSASDGMYPQGGLTFSAGTLYGTGYYGGIYNSGTIFKVNTDGSGYTLLHEFSGVDGRYPNNGNLTLAGGTLYGMASMGGAANKGVVFKVDADGSDFTLLHEFAGTDGYLPCGSLTLSGSTLYGMTQLGGVSDMGVIFKVDTDGSGYRILHEFTGGSDDGKYPSGSLTLYNGELYGVTGSGGTDDLGTLFKIQLDGSDFTLLHQWANDGGGKGATGDLTIASGMAYGITTSGGEIENWMGTIYKYEVGGGGDVPEPSTLLLLLPFIGFGLKKWRGKKA